MNWLLSKRTFWGLFAVAISGAAGCGLDPLAELEQQLQPAAAAPVNSDGDGAADAAHSEPEPPPGNQPDANAGNVGAGDEPGDDATDLNTPSDSNPYFITSQTYDSDTDDIAAAIQADYGPSATLAEWNDVKAEYGDGVDGIRQFMDDVGMTDYNDDGSGGVYWVTYDGAEFWSDRRHYHVTRQNGASYGWFLYHDDIQGRQMALGSWWGQYQALIRLSDAAPLTADAGPDRTVVAGASVVLEGRATGGTPPYVYSWQPASTLDDPDVAQPTAIPSVTTTYTLMVSDADGQTASDNTVVTVVALDEACDHECGEMLVSGETVSCSIDSASELDAFPFDGVAGQRVRIVESVTGGGLDAEIILYSPAGGGAEAAAHYPWGGSATIDTVLQATGTYTVVVQDYGQGETGQYALTLLNLSDPFACDDDPPDSDAICSGQTLSGTVNHASDLDAFVFDGAAGQRVRIVESVTGGGLDAEIILYPPGGGGAAAATHYPWSGSATIDTVLQAAGQYTIVVQDYGQGETGTYALTLLNLSDPFACNDHPPDGGAIQSAETLTGSINQASDLDAFIFEGSMGQRVRIVKTVTEGGLDAEIILYPPGGGAAEAAAHYPWGGSATIDKTLHATGTYTIVVQDYGQGETGEYSISLLQF